jgi:hypothetical protein
MEHAVKLALQGATAAENPGIENAEITPKNNNRRGLIFIDSLLKRALQIMHLLRQFTI